MLEFVCFINLLSCPNNIGSVLDPASLPSLGSLVSSLPHPAGHRNAVFIILLVFCSFSGLVFSSFVFRLDIWGRPFVSQSRRQIIGLVVPVNSNLVPYGLGVLLERILISVSIFICFLSFPFISPPFLTFLCSFSPPFSSLFRVCVCITA